MIWVYRWSSKPGSSIGLKEVTEWGIQGVVRESTEVKREHYMIANNNGYVNKITFLIKHQKIEANHANIKFCFLLVLKPEITRQGRPR